MFTYERRINSEISFYEDEVKLAKTMMDKLRTTVEFLYYLTKHRGHVSLFVSLQIKTVGRSLEKYIDIKQENKSNKVFFCRI